MKRYEIINHLVKYFGYETYLEIGLQNAANCFDKVIALKKVSVDPDIAANPMILATSDEFFEENKFTYDIIFIDGLHEADQVYRDINNALKILNPNGTIICHDMLPTTEEMQKVPRETKVWTGDGYKSFLKLRCEREDLNMFTIDTDFGCGIIRTGKQKKLNISFPITYQDFYINRSKWMNIISVEEFLNGKWNLHN